MKTLLVTGASSGVGWALAKRAARAGYAVYGVGRNRTALAALAAHVRGEDGTIEVDAVDIALAANAAPLIARVLARFGGLDVLVNNAGYASAGALVAQPDDELERQFGTHVIGPVALVREAHAALRTARGIVFMVGSGVARIPIGGLGAYPPAKAALRSASTILRRELAPDGIALTYVDPGAIDTPFMQRAGMPGAPAILRSSPDAVARKILVAVADRPRELAAVRWQTALVGLAECFPRLTDALLARTPGLVGGSGDEGAAATSAGVESPQAPADVPALSYEANESPRIDDAVPPVIGEEALLAATAICAELTASPAATANGPVAEAAIGEASPFAQALEPHRRRMEKLNLRESFIRELLVPNAHLDPVEIAMRWAGMPNKNERAITDDVLAALASAGYLEPSESRGYRVLRQP